jgi:hypothetical protein
MPDVLSVTDLLPFLNRTPKSAVIFSVFLLLQVLIEMLSLRVVALPRRPQTPGAVMLPMATPPDGG